MAATGRSEETASAVSDIAARLRDAGLVRLVGAPTGDGVAAVGLLTLALEAHDVAHHSSVVALPEPASRATDADMRVALGRPVPDAAVTLGTDGTPASATALAVATELGTVDYELGLAGIVAAGGRPSSDVLGAASDRGIEREPGIATPTPALAEGLAHSGLVHTSFSGDQAVASELLESSGTDESADPETRRTLASMVAVTVCEDEQAIPAAADAVERFLRPLVAPGGRFETVEGYGDVLDATARASPELGVPLALGAVETTTALETWRTHTQQAHETVRSASTGRYDGLFVVRCSGDAPLGTVARLVADYRSPEPLVLVLDDTGAVARAAGEPQDHVGDRLGRAASHVGGVGGGGLTRGRATFDGEPTEFVAVFREER
jgi:hypothetical protein